MKFTQFDVIFVMKRDARVLSGRVARTADEADRRGTVMPR
jgi:hypothetical protein